MEHCVNKKGALSIATVQLQTEVLTNTAGPAAADSAPVDTPPEAPEAAAAAAVRSLVEAAAAALWPQESGVVNKAKLAAAQLLLAAPAHTLDAVTVGRQLTRQIRNLTQLLPGRKKRVCK